MQHYPTTTLDRQSALPIARTPPKLYDILMEQLLRAIRKYDPAYKEKVKQVVEVIDGKLSRRKQFSAVDVGRHLGFDPDRYLRMLVRRGHLEAVGGGVFERRAGAWPPTKLLEGEPIGLTYCVQTWFRYYLQQWISDAMMGLIGPRRHSLADCLLCKMPV